MLRALVAAVTAAVILAALLIGPGTFAAVVLVLAALTLLDLTLLLARSGARPVLPVAAIPGLALPAVLLTDPARGWERLPGYFAAAVLAVFALMLLFGRRDRIAAGVGGTFTAGLVVGLGASALLLLRDLPDGFRWVLALGVLVLVAEIAGPLLRLLRARAGWEDDGGDDLPTEPVTAPLEGIAPALLAVIAGGAVLAVTLDPPVGAVAAVMLAAIALVAALGGGYLQRALSAEAGVDVRWASLRPGDGVILGVVDALLLGAPAAYILARSAAL